MSSTWNTFQTLISTNAPDIGVYSRQARFKVRSYDKNILHAIHKELIKLEINTKIRLERKKGLHYGRMYNGDTWGVYVNEKSSLLKLFDFMEPYMKHEKRLYDLKRARQNIIERNKKYK